MNKEILNIIKQNSLNETFNSNVNESTDSSSVDSAFDSIIGTIIETVIPNTIAGSVCSVQPLTKGPDGKVFGVKRTVDSLTNEIKLKVQSKKIHSNYNKRHRTNFTTESINELESTTGFTETKIFTSAAAAESSLYVDSIIIPVLRNLAKPMQPIVLDGNPETAYYQLLYNTHLALVDINNKTKRGISGFAILSPTLAALFAQFNNIYNDPREPITDENNIFFLGETRLVKYYVDPLAPKDDIIVGYKSDIEGETALIYAPYIFSMYNVVEAEGTDTYYHTLTRFGYARNPLDNGYQNHDSDFLRIFNCDVSNVGDITNSGNGQKLSTALSNYTRDDSTATAGQTDISSSGSGTIPRLFINGEYIEDRYYTWAAPTVTLSYPLNVNDSISLETYDIA